MKYILITLLSFTFATQITTREFSVQINESTEFIDVSEYVNLESGYYNLNLINSLSSNFNEQCDSLGISLYGIFGYMSVGVDDFPNANFNIERNGVTISPNNSLLSNDNDNQTILDIDNNCEIDFELVFHISGRFENEDTSMGDMNNDGSLNIYDILELVNIILEGDSGDIFDVMEIIKRV